MSDSECLSCGSLAVRYCEQCYRALKITSRLLSNALITADADAELELAQKIATIEAQEQENARLTHCLQDANWQPKPGIWLVTEQPGVRSQSWLAQGDVPEPVTLAKLYQWRDMIAQSVLKAWQVYATKGSQSPSEVADMILDYLYQETTKNK